MKKARSVLLALAFAAFAAAPARADVGTILSGTFTGGNTFATRMSVNMQYCFGVEDCPAAGTGIYYIGIGITNEAMYGEVYKAVGLINIPAGATVDDVTDPYENSLPGWDGPPPDDLGGAGLPDGTWAWISPNPAPKEGLQPGQNAWFVFRIQGVTLEQVMALGAGVHGVSGPNGCSVKFGVWNGGATTNDVGPSGYDASCVSTTVPEPASVLLMGTGLFGIALLRRRRRGLELVDENGDSVTA